MHQDRFHPGKDKHQADGIADHRAVPLRPKPVENPRIQRQEQGKVIIDPDLSGNHVKIKEGQKPDERSSSKPHHQRIAGQKRIIADINHKHENEPHRHVKNLLLHKLCSADSGISRCEGSALTDQRLNEQAQRA